MPASAGRRNAAQRTVETDDNTFLIRLAANFSSSTVQLARADAVPSDGITVPGVLQGGLVRTR